MAGVSSRLFDVDLTSNGGVQESGGSEEPPGTEEGMANGSSEPMEEDQATQAERRSGRRKLSVSWTLAVEHLSVHHTHQWSKEANF